MTVARGGVRRRPGKTSPSLFNHICMGQFRMALEKRAVPAVTGGPMAAPARSPCAGPVGVSAHLGMTQDLAAQGGP